MNSCIDRLLYVFMKSHITIAFRLENTLQSFGNIVHRVMSIKPMPFITSSTWVPMSMSQVAGGGEWLYVNVVALATPKEEKKKELEKIV
jgi:hypothetical protein